MPDKPLTLEIRFRLLRRLEITPETSQRALAEELDISLGKVNYCLRSLIEQGWVKTESFGEMGQGNGVTYRITEQGAAEKARIADRFLALMLSRHAALTKEIAQIRVEIKAAKKNHDPVCRQNDISA